MLRKTILFILQLGIRPQNDDLTVDEAWDDIVGRIKYIFSDEVSSSKDISGFYIFINITMSLLFILSVSLLD